MVDSDNVLLLKPARPQSGFALAGLRRDAGSKAQLYVATIYYLEPAAITPFLDWFELAMAPQMRAAHGAPIASFVTEFSPNTFPRLPVRDASVFVVFQRFADVAAHQAYLQRVHQLGDWREQAPAEVLRQFGRRPEVLRLEPTSRSLLR